MSSSKTKPAQASSASNGGSTVPGKRQLLLGIVLGAAACAGWHLGVRPVEQKFNESAAELRALNTQLDQFDRMLASEPPLDRVIEALSTKGRRTNRASFLTSDATRLYDAVHDLAKVNNVKLSRVEPSAVRSPKAGTDKAIKGAELFGYNIEISGTYESICKFIDSCEQDLGVSKVVSFHIAVQTNAPAGGNSTEPMLTAIVETSHLKLVIPSVGTDAPAHTANATEEKGS